MTNAAPDALSKFESILLWSEVQTLLREPDFVRDAIDFAFRNYDTPAATASRAGVDYLVLALLSEDIQTVTAGRERLCRLYLTARISRCESDADVLDRILRELQYAHGGR
jgi:hypothetical protein